MICVREGQYRSSQEAVIALIKNNASDAELWPALVEYQKQQAIYVEKIDKIIFSVSSDIRNGYRNLLECLIVIVVVILICANALLVPKRKTGKERRACAICKDPLPGILSLTLEKKSPEGIYKPVRVCGKCFHAADLPKLS
jgi:hypothetical protein